MALGTAITVATIALIASLREGRRRPHSPSSARRPRLVMRGLELGAAALVLLFGVGLLLGDVAGERGTCF